MPFRTIYETPWRERNGLEQKLDHHAVPEPTSLFALLWRTRVIRHAHAASHVPSDTAGEHDTSTPVLVRPRGRAPTSESGVREHAPENSGVANKLMRRFYRSTSRANQETGYFFSTQDAGRFE